jgi:hypothetical protein
MTPTDRDELRTAERIVTALSSEILPIQWALLSEIQKPEGDRDPARGTESRRTAVAVLGRLEERLAERDWLVGDQMSLYDVILGSNLLPLRAPAEFAEESPMWRYFAENLRIEEERPRVSAWVGRVVAHDGWRRNSSSILHPLRRRNPRHGSVVGWAMKPGVLLLLAFSLECVSALTLSAQEAPEHRFTIAVDSVDVVFELRGSEVVALSEEIRHTAEAAFSYDIELFGSLPAQFQDGDFEHITIAVVEGDDLRGESEPSRIDMTMPPPKEPLDHFLWKGVLAHEIFHLWNAEGFRYASVEEQWLSEGFTQYYTLRTLGRMGVLDEPTFLYVLGRLLGMYLTDPGLGSISMREAGPAKEEHTGLVEGGGLAVALCLDVELRTASGGEKSLDDVMRHLFARHGAADRRYSLADVKAYVSEVRGEDRSAFFGDYVAGTATLPLNDCLAPAGLTLTVEENVAQVRKNPASTDSQLQLLDALRGL